jgi:hypothetical protein
MLWYTCTVISVHPLFNGFSTYEFIFWPLLPIIWKEMLPMHLSCYMQPFFKKLWPLDFFSMKNLCLRYSLPKPFVQMCILQREWCSQLYKGILAWVEKVWGRIMYRLVVPSFWLETVLLCWMLILGIEDVHVPRILIFFNIWEKRNSIHSI